MVTQLDAAERRKRKSSKSRDGPKREQKRKRPTDDEPQQVDRRLLEILTGKNEEEDLKKIDSENSSEIEEEESGSSSGEDKASDAEEKPREEHETSAGAAAASGATNDTWPRRISDAHAKKVNVTVLLERANLETVKQSGRSGGMVLLNCEDHRHVLKKSGRDANDARPDITHQCLLALMDSPLNKAGRLKVYIRTAKNVLIEVHPQTRVPRTIRRFSGLMAELLEKFKVRGTSGSTPLLKVIRNPITSHLPVGTRKVVCTYNTDNIVDMREHAAKMAALAIPEGLDVAEDEEAIEEKAEEVNVLYVIGAMAHGKVSEDWADDNISVSEYPLSAATVCSRLTYTYECLFGIL